MTNAWLRDCAEDSCKLEAETFQTFEFPPPEEEFQPVWESSESDGQEDAPKDGTAAPSSSTAAAAKKEEARVPVELKAKPESIERVTDAPYTPTKVTTARARQRTDFRSSPKEHWVCGQFQASHHIWSARANTS